MNSRELNEKYEMLIASLRGMDGVLVAFSGGVDSSLLLAAAREAQGERVLAVTARSATYPGREYDEAAEVAARLGVRHATLTTEEILDPAFRRNPPDRCFFCKKELFTRLKALARREGLSAVAEGSNLDDRSDHRPGRRAGRELGILAPLADAGLTKEDIRALARAKGLPNWNKPALACLASRIPFGEEITEGRLRRVERAEDSIRSLGFREVRVRDHGSVARVEVGRGEIDRFLEGGNRDRAVSALKRAGYRFVALDLEGYRTGAMNETLSEEERAL